MKKLVCLMIVALIGTVASAAVIELLSPATAEVGDIVTINLYSDVTAGDFTVLSISDGGAGGSASNAVVTAGFDWVIFTGPGTLNTGGFLVENATGKTNFGSPLVGGILYSFDYTVAAAPIGTIINFTADGNVGGTIISGAAMEVIPEPITIALLGLGGLFLRRRK